MNRGEMVKELEHAKMLLTTNDFGGTSVVEPERAVVSMLQNIVESLQKEILAK